jgi:hypothetical protein
VAYKQKNVSHKSVFPLEEKSEIYKQKSNSQKPIFFFCFEKLVTQKHKKKSPKSYVIYVRQK